MMSSLFKHLLAMWLLASLAVLSPDAPRAEDAAQAIEQRLRDWTADFNAGRVDTLCDRFTPDLIANYRGQPEKSFDSLCAALQSDLAGGPHHQAGCYQAAGDDGEDLLAIRTVRRGVGHRSMPRCRAVRCGWLHSVMRVRRSGVWQAPQRQARGVGWVQPSGQ